MSVAVAAPERDLLEVLVSMDLQVACLERLLSRLCSSGIIGDYREAGEARTAMIATALALRSSDMLFGTARDVPAALAHGVPVSDILAQALGKSGDPGRGRGMPGAITHQRYGVSLTDGNIASHTVHASGFGQAAQIRGDERVACALIGSGALANGEVHAGFNFAALSAARTLFIVRGEVGDGVSLEGAGDSWGLPVVVVRGDDGQAVFGAVREARSRAISGEGPTLVDARLPAQIEPLDWRAHQARGGWSAEHHQEVLRDIESVVRDARKEAEGGEDIRPASLFEDVFADRPWFLQPNGTHEVTP
jgi:TPP-dependent pyruvate/acetoin dehydrogenase alpha subunit